MELEVSTIRENVYMKKSSREDQLPHEVYNKNKKGR
jgi:hypothetical protein